jgi:sulfonate transport system permease protein
VVLTILLYALLGKAADSTARFLERSWLSWHHAQRPDRAERLGGVT